MIQRYEDSGDGMAENRTYELMVRRRKGKLEILAVDRDQRVAFDITDELLDQLVAALPLIEGDE